jgi:hypothetical protein
MKDIHLHKMDDDSYDESGSVSFEVQQSEHEYSDEVRFENEYNVYDRVGGTFGELGTINTDIDMRDPIQRFTQFTRTVAKDMITQKIIDLKIPDINYIIEQIQYFKNIKYKNPTAFILGFWVTKNDGTIDKNRVKKLIPKLPSLTYPIREFDVIRYANLWISTNLYYTG